MPRTLSIGMTGSDVADLQAALNYHLHTPIYPEIGPFVQPLEVDGIFGDHTDERLREFQRLNNLDDDGVVGRNTRPMLNVVRRITVKIPIFNPNDDDPPAIGANSVGSSVGFAGLARPGGGGPRQGLRSLSSGGLFASPPQTAPPSPIIQPVQLANRQVQVGGNLTLDPLIGPGAPSKAIFLAVQWTWVERKDGRHLELSLGTQFARGLAKNTGDLNVSVQSFAQVSIADLVTLGSNFHLFNLSAQASYQGNFLKDAPGSTSIGVSVQNQITWDMFKIGENQTFSFFCQQQLGWTYDLHQRKGTVAPSFLGGAIWQTTF